jgi:hypothetical protein
MPAWLEDSKVSKVLERWAPWWARVRLPVLLLEFAMVVGEGDVDSGREGKTGEETSKIEADRPCGYARI